MTKLNQNFNRTNRQNMSSEKVDLLRHTVYNNSFKKLNGSNNYGSRPGTSAALTKASVHDSSFRNIK